MFKIVYIDCVVKKDIPKLGSREKTTIRKAIETLLTQDPVGFGKPLRYSLAGHRRLRVGSYRVVYRIDREKNQVVISAIKHRKDVYED